MRLVVGLCVALAAACGGHHEGGIDKTIGAACGSDRDCDDRCYTGGDFPGGYCSVSCESDADCPVDTFCMSESDGVCLFACPGFECARLGPGWECRERSRRGGGTTTVCSGG